MSSFQVADDALAQRRAPVTPLSRLHWSDQSCNYHEGPHWPSGQRQIEIFPLFGPHQLTVSFAAPSTALDSLSVDFASLGRTNGREIECELKGAIEGSMRRRSLAPEVIGSDGLHTALDLAGVDFRTGGEYTLVLSAPAEVQGAHIGYRGVRAGPALPEQRRRLSFKNHRTFVYEGATGGVIKEDRFILVAPSDGAGLERAAEAVTRAFPGQTFTVLDMNPVERLWPRLADADMVVFAEETPGDPLGPDGFEALAFELFRRGVCTVWLSPDPLPGTDLRYSKLRRQQVRGRTDAGRVCRFLLARDGGLRDTLNPDRPDPALAEITAPELVELARNGRQPRVAVLTTFEQGANDPGALIGCLTAQTFPGPIELFLLGDSRSDQAAIVQAKLQAQTRSSLTVQMVNTVAGHGHLAGQLQRLTAEADLCVFLDRECVISPDFLAAHVYEHARWDVDAVIGASMTRNGARGLPTELVSSEMVPVVPPDASGLSDPLQTDGFLNCTTRNFSLKRRSLLALTLSDAGLLVASDDEAIWKDVALGYALYLAGAVIRRSEKAVSIQFAESRSSTDRIGTLEAVREFERLFVHCPELLLIARRWAVLAYERLMAQALAEGVDEAPPLQMLRRGFGELSVSHWPLNRALSGQAKRLRILTYRWHVPHQYELQKLPHDFTLATHTGIGGNMDRWSSDQRPLRPNVRFVPAALIDPRDYDVAILHFDENVLSPEFCNGGIPTNWGAAFSWLLAQANLPKIAVCHGTPQFVGQYSAHSGPLAAFETHEPSRRLLVETLSAHSVQVVCNSHQAREEWRFQNSRVIWHGLDPIEFPEGRHDLDVLALAPDFERPHYRGTFEQQEVLARLHPRIRVGTPDHPGAGLERRDTYAYAVRQFRSYVDHIGRFRVYLNTTRRSPMPRSRAEAMMTGAAPASLRNHDVDLFIEPGLNGFYADEAGELADWLNFLYRRPDLIGPLNAAARRTAMDLFNIDRYLNAWSVLLDEAIG